MGKEIANSKLGRKFHHFWVQNSQILGSKICIKTKTATMCKSRNQKVVHSLGPTTFKHYD